MDNFRDATEEERDQDISFLTHILFEIVEYAKTVGQQPDDTLKAVAEWILGLLQVATFNKIGEEG